MRIGVDRAVVAGELIDGDVSVAEGHVEAVGLEPAGTGHIAMPGFVDIHFHGHGGVDFVDAGIDEHRRIARAVTAFGTTSYLPTLMSMPTETLLAAMSSHPGTVDGGARVHGYHLEGPFLSPSKPGAHNPDHLELPSPELIGRFLDVGTVAHITIAPEIPGASGAIRDLVDAGVVVSLGHSTATAEETHSALDAGASVFTHVFNAMGQLDQREAGILSVALASDRGYLTGIFDGVHLDDEIAQLLIKCAGERLVAITDGTSAIGLEGSAATLGQMTAELVDGAPRYPDGTIAGSILTMDSAFRKLVDLDLTLVEASLATSTNPAKAAKLENVGTLGVGEIADIVVLDDRLEVVRTYVNGDRVFPG